ncbi:pectinesterase family protein [Streptomyces sp. NBC_00525]|uniref:pectinesterase family protein n=1 Tax=Streptomyces sp. NBC_00525 TaxID=2903660 RepID=UPI002E8018DB|nr:pectinesterase family protein [Streptomyces sp. NBC_00525]WUC95529.1 pectinesterase family protein [Streptomyces sp. NBC_00525]
MRTEPPRTTARGRAVAGVVSVLAVVAGGLAVSVSSAGSAAAASVPAVDTAYQLVVAKSGKCIDVPGASRVAGAELQQWGCTADSPWQQFRLRSAGSGVYTLVGESSGQCIDVPGGSTVSGVRVIQWGCGAGKANQQWTLTPSRGDTWQIVNVKSGLCLSDELASTSNGTAIIQETCTHNTNKQWTFKPVAGSGERPTVAADGSGTYRTVQAAIDAVPANNTRPVEITIAPGSYRETVRIPGNKPYITLRGLGSGPSSTVVVNNHSAGEYGTSGSATMFVEGHDFKAVNLTVSNDFDENSRPSGQQALAMSLNSDRSVLDNVRLLGDQDTLLVNNSARSYAVNSYVEGTVDFIYGGGTIVFDHCDIYEKRSTGGPITAASTDPGKKYGFLFYKSNITGAPTNRTQLGRPWRQGAQVLFRESTLSSTIAKAQPWIDMSSATWKNARFTEYRNTGSGAGVNGNRPQLSDSAAADYTPQKYLAGNDGWNPVR